MRTVPKQEIAQQAYDTGAEVMGLTDAKTWDEAAVFVIAELGSLKRQLAGQSTHLDVAKAAIEELNKRLDTFRQAVDYEGARRRLSELERKQEADTNSLTTQIADLEADQQKLEGQVKTLAAGKAVFTIEREIAGYSPPAPTQPTETSQYSPFCAKPCLDKTIRELEEALAEWQGGFHKRGDHLRAAETKVTELEVERNLAKARISAITDKLRSLVTQLRVQNTTAPHWRSDTAVGAYRHSANLLETALIELALVEAPADSAHAAKEHAEGLARMLAAGTAVQVDMKPQPALLMTEIAPCDYAYGIRGEDRAYANVFKNCDGAWTADFGQDQPMQSLERDTLPGVMRALNQITGRYYQLPSGAVPYCK